MNGRLHMDAGKEAIASLGLTGATTLADLVRLAYLPALAKANSRLYATAARVLADLPFIAQEPISAFTEAAMRSFLERLTWEKGLGRSAVSSTFGHLKRAFALAFDCGLIPANPCDAIDPEPRSFKPADLGANPTFSQFAMWGYLPACRAIQRVTSFDVSALAHYAIPVFGDVPLAGLSSAQIRSFLAAHKASLANLDYARLFYAMEGLCALAIEKGYLAAEAWAGLDEGLRAKRVQETRLAKFRPRVGKPRRFLSPEDAKRVMAALKEGAAAKAEARILLLVMLTGVAQGEISTAKWAGFDLRARTLKAGVSGRVVYLSAQAADFVASLGHGKSPWLFPNAKNSGRPCSELAVRRFFEKTMLALGLVGFGVSDLRIPYVRFLFERQVPAETVGRLVGFEPAEFSGLMGAAQ